MLLGVSSTQEVQTLIEKEAAVVKDAKLKSEALRSQKLSNWLGIEDDSAAGGKEKEKMKTLKVLAGKPKNKTSNDALPSTNAKEVANNRSKNVTLRHAKSTDSLPKPQSNRRAVSLYSPVVPKEQGDESLSSLLDVPKVQDPSKRTGKLAEFFGVTTGQKEMDEIDNIIQQKYSNALGKNKRYGVDTTTQTFIVRVYLGNLTYTSICLPLESTAEHAINALLKKFGIRESASFYGIFEYQQITGGERELHSNERLFDIMIQWEYTEFFLFKRKSTIKALRWIRSTDRDSHDLSSETSNISRQTTISSTVEGKIGVHNNTRPNHESAKRVAKLADFFGVKADMPTSGGGWDSDARRKVEQGQNEIMELYRMLNIMGGDIAMTSNQVNPLQGEVGDGYLLYTIWSTSDLVIFTYIHKLFQQKIQVATIYKEGWLTKEDRKVSRTCWGSIENGVLKITVTASKEEVVPSDARGTQVLTIPLENAIVESIQMGVSSSRKQHTVQLLDAKGDRYAFSVSTAQEADDWVRAIKMSSKNAGRYGESMIMKTSSMPQSNRTTDVLKDAAHENLESSSGSQQRPRDGGRRLSISDFDIHKVIGRGKYGKVLLCSQKSTGKVYAIKVVSKEQDSSPNQSDGKSPSSSAHKESQILRSIRHPFIVGLHCAFQSREKLYLVMEYINGGELFFHVSNFGRFSEERVRFYAAEILLAVECLHGKGIIYRDLKLENILLAKDGHVKITDFGLSKQEDEDDTELVGTLEYLAPEVLQGRPCTFTVDWWAYGVVVFEMLNGFHPFYSENREEIKRNILRAPIEFPNDISNDSRDLIARLLQRNPKERLGCGGEGGLEIRNHPFFASIDFAKLFNKAIEPPFKPDVVDDFDVSFFDDLFTKEPAFITPTGSKESIFVADSRMSLATPNELKRQSNQM
ncbi:RAC-alpha serine/threonine-protein kinase [Quaeritorhiza haematococci]|nr:RAC-alpha serine/threonine-protein kinase [Quaeritorhiza haematococci]